jgi:alginate O-acetyltransferase complex protein AlgI
MTFTTFTFLAFLVVTFTCYWLLPSRRAQNALLLVAGYVFYGWWDWRFGCLLLVSSCVDFFVGSRLGVVEAPAARKRLLALSLCVNLGMLGFFKYANFFADSAASFASALGMHVHPWVLNVVLPLGLSFYTFQTLSYAVDIYRKQLKPAESFLDYLAFVSFFPQLVAGPIERAGWMLPQFSAPRVIDSEDIQAGMRQMLWGFTKKLVLADNLARIVDAHYTHVDGEPGPVLWLATFCFALQIYLDFSGYSDIAIGTGRLFGFRLTRNFAYPYFSRSVAEFWRRWHISLSTWFRDYVYIPLGGSRTSRARQASNLLITFTISGLWHGASYNYVIWGALNGLWMLPAVFQGHATREGATADRAGLALLPSPLELWQMARTFAVICATWVFFRAATLHDAVTVFQHGVRDLLSPDAYAAALAVLRAEKGVFMLLALFMAVEWLQRRQPYGLALVWPRPLRWVAYSACIWLCVFRMPNDAPAFIYFQF